MPRQALMCECVARVCRASGLCPAPRSQRSYGLKRLDLRGWLDPRGANHRAAMPETQRPYGSCVGLDSLYAALQNICGVDPLE
eukprot:356778-Chlamydomonas_euryale.AAC.7